MTTTYDLTSSFVQTVGANGDAAREVLSTIEPMRSLADRLSALGLDDRALWSESGEHEYTLIWRFGDGSEHARLDWQLTVSKDGVGRTYLALTLAGRGSDAAATARLVASWTLLEELAQAHTRRLARTLDDYADADVYSAAPVPLRAVV